MPIEWEDKGREINGYVRFLRPYHIVPRWFGRPGYVLHLYASRERRKFDTVEEAKKFAEADLERR